MSMWCVKVTQSCPTLCDPINYTVHGILQAMGFSREYWSGLSFPFSRGSSQPRDRTQVSCIAGGFFTHWTIREALSYKVKIHFFCKLCYAELDQDSCLWTFYSLYLNWLLKPSPNCVCFMTQFNSHFLYEIIPVPYEAYIAFIRT